MRYLLLLVLVLGLNKLLAQQSTDELFSSDFIEGQHFLEMHSSSPNPEFLDFNEGAKLITISTGDIYFYKSYLVNKRGETLSAGYMPSSYFLPNDNPIVISGYTNRVKDSFNPYGANDMASMIVLATFNNFISLIKWNRK